MSRIQKIRNAAFKAQDGRCYYCEAKMVMLSADRHPLPNLPKSYLRRLQCTAEHLVAASEGGTMRQDNIVAACLHCNATRHRTKKPKSPEQYKRHVEARLRSGRWWPLQGEARKILLEN